MAGALVRSVNWAHTPLGPIDAWPASLKTTVGILLHSRHPMFLWWGPELIQIYNDAYIPSFGVGKHPAAMGQAGRDCWQEIWPIIWPQIDDVMTRGKASWNEDHLVPIFRNGGIEEVYWTYGYSAVYDDHGQIGGTLVVCTETTARVLGERRQRALSLVTQRTAALTSAAEVMDEAFAALATASADVAWVVGYDVDHATGVPRLARSNGVPRAALGWLSPILLRHVATLAGSSSPWHGPLELSPDEKLASASAMPGGPWPEPSSEVFIAPIGGAIVVFGLSPRLPFDVPYRDYVIQISHQLALAASRAESLRIRAAAEGERNNLLLQAPIPTAILVGPEHVYQLANAPYVQMVGGRRLVGKTYAEAFPELIGTALPGILDQVYRTGEPFVTKELAIPLELDGRRLERFFTFNLEAIRDLDGLVYGMMVVAVEITEQVNARHVLEKTQAEREKLLATLEEASRAKDEFLAMLGHELRNPLSPIITALELIKLRGSAGATTKELDVVERQVTHLVRLVDDLLDISRITRGKVELRQERIDLAGVLGKAVEMASLLLEQREHRLTIDVAAGLRWQGDPVRLAQVVANLMTNAARYTDPGGKIALRAFADGKDVVISVADNGRGIPAELLPRVFDLFVQGARAADRAKGGLGIGLALVKNLVEMHGGSVAAFSAGLGQGSEFVIRLPAAPAGGAVEPPRAGERGRSVMRDRATRRILVVDDNTDGAWLLAEMLGRIGHQVAVANDPIAALALLPSARPEVAIVDIGLPIMDGYELAVRMREDPVGAGCHIIALTGYGQANDRARSREAGFDDHLVKPVDVAKLLALIDRGRAAKG